jgi:hydrogenase expression/formation protein HypD
MHICGTHEYTIAKNGIRTILPSNLEIISGPGCPVCVCPASDIDLAIELTLKKRVIMTTFGDMLRVPATDMTLYEAKAQGGDVRIVYGPHDAVELAQKHPDREVVFFAIGFETTAPLPAFEIVSNPPKNFSIICANKVVPPAFDLLMKQEDIKIEGFILPGHVCSIIGSDPFIPYAQKYKSPMVVGGFEVNDVLISIYYILQQIKDGTTLVQNTYTRVVKPKGNETAQGFIKKAFHIADSVWRGIGPVPMSGLFLNPEYQKYDAIQKFGIKLSEKSAMPKGCLCAQVLMGRKKAQECVHFGKDCTPAHPIGPCMVSHEGTCKISHMFQNIKSK